tara:strand:- start:7746 stop:8321 length:576 start_codon:yes stop_codon:yes gene_type:complete
MFRKLLSILCIVMVFGFTQMLFAQTVVETTTDSNSRVNSEGRTIVISPPPSAISPSAGGSSQDLCTVGISGAVQTQILGISTGETVTDQNCERLKISKTLYDMGMKVAAVSVMCQDKRVFDAMGMAGTPCPYEGKIGEEAKEAWKTWSGKKKVPIEFNPETKADVQKRQWETGRSVISGALLFVLLLVAAN